MLKHDATELHLGLRLPKTYNAAVELLSCGAGLPDKIAYVDEHGALSYRELRQNAVLLGSALRCRGLQQEDRVVIAMHDCVDWPVVFLGCLYAGLVAVPVNTLLTAREYDYILADCRAKALFLSAPLFPVFEPLLGKQPFLKHTIADRSALRELLQHGDPAFAPAQTVGDEAGFWLYSSGSTGAPKGCVHAHQSLLSTAQLYGQQVLGITQQDVFFSAAKLFFAYGLGNSLTFPLSVGATTVLMAEKPTPSAVFARLTKYRPTLFFGVPTLYASLLASADFPPPSDLHLRLCTSAGEALPAELGRKWTKRTGVEVLDGIGSTELLHIFLSNRPKDVCWGSSGRPVPGYRVKVTDEHDQPVKPGEVGDLYVSGPSGALCYAHRRELSRRTFLGEWTRTGDKYSFSEDGVYTYAGRSDDLLKVSGIYVSPFEVEAALLTHPATLEAAVVGMQDENELTKAKAFVVLQPGRTGDEALKTELLHTVKALLAPYKVPRWIEFLPELPKTATGKIQRFKLRGTAAKPF